MASTTAPLQQSLWGHRPLSTNPIDASPEWLDDASVVLHQHDWLEGADTAFAELEHSVSWRSMRRPMYDRIVDVPRLIATLERDRLDDGSAAAVIVDVLGDLIGASLEQVGLNLYRDGNDSVAWHRDRIGVVRDWSVIALVSLGGPRQLQMRPWRSADRSGRRRVFTLQSGDLLVMAGACQRDWEHAVLKTSSAPPRISLAVRTKQVPQGPLLQHMGVTP